MLRNGLYKVSFCMHVLLTTAVGSGESLKTAANTGSGFALLILVDRYAGILQIK